MAMVTNWAVPAYLRSVPCARAFKRLGAVALNDDRDRDRWWLTVQLLITEMELLGLEPALAKESSSSKSSPSIGNLENSTSKRDACGS